MPSSRPRFHLPPGVIVPSEKALLDRVRHASGPTGHTISGEHTGDRRLPSRLPGVRRLTRTTPVVAQASVDELWQRFDPSTPPPRLYVVAYSTPLGSTPPPAPYFVTYPTLGVMTCNEKALGLPLREFRGTITHELSHIRHLDGRQGDDQDSHEQELRADVEGAFALGDPRPLADYFRRLSCMSFPSRTFIDEIRFRLERGEHPKLQRRIDQLDQLDAEVFQPIRHGLWPEGSEPVHADQLLVPDPTVRLLPPKTQLSTQSHRTAGHLGR